MNGLDRYNSPVRVIVTKKNLDFEVKMLDGCITQEELFRVLKAYSVLNPVEGYCQAQVRIVIVIIFFVIIVTPNILVATFVKKA